MTSKIIGKPENFQPIIQSTSHIPKGTVEGTIRGTSHINPKCNEILQIINPNYSSFQLPDSYDTYYQFVIISKI